MVQINFNANEHEANDGDFTAMPEGWYPAIIDESGMAKSQAGNDMLKLRFSIVGDKYANRKVFENFIQNHSNPKVVEIANGKLSAICKAIDVFRVNDTQELHGKVMQIKLKVDGNYNAVTGFKKYEGQNIVVAAQPPQQSNAAPPWNATPADSNDDIPY